MLRDAILTISAAVSNDDEAGPSRLGDDTDLTPGTTGWSDDITFREAQLADPMLEPARRNLALREGGGVDTRRAERLPRLEKVRGVMWWVAAPEKGGGTPQRQLVVPAHYREQLLWQAHGHSWVGHQGKIRTLSRVMGSFFWPFISQNVQRFCCHCEQCLKATKRMPPKAPLQSMPIIEQPFARIAMDFVGPLPCLAHRHHFLLVIVDFTTHYPEAIPLREMHVPGVAQALLQLVS